jgi:hypothetical protein
MLNLIKYVNPERARQKFSKFGLRFHGGLADKYTPPEAPFKNWHNTGFDCFSKDTYAVFRNNKKSTHRNAHLFTLISR